MLQDGSPGNAKYLCAGRAASPAAGDWALDFARLEPIAGR